MLSENLAPPSPAYTRPSFPKAHNHCSWKHGGPKLSGFPPTVPLSLPAPPLPDFVRTGQPDRREPGVSLKKMYFRGKGRVGTLELAVINSAPPLRSFSSSGPGAGAPPRPQTGRGLPNLAPSRPHVLFFASAHDHSRDFARLHGSLPFPLFLRSSSSHCFVAIFVSG